MTIMEAKDITVEAVVGSLAPVQIMGPATAISLTTLIFSLGNSGRVPKVPLEPPYSRALQGCY